MTKGRKITKPVRVGDLTIGGGRPITVQSMCNTKTQDIEATIAQIGRLGAAGCQIVRLAVPDMEGARAIYKIKERVSLPIVADIHFDYKLGVESAQAGADKIRINPGNIGSKSNVAAVVAACRSRNIPIRIGVNGGSLEKEILAKYNGATPEAMVESAMGHVAILHQFDFDDIVISLKSSDVAKTIAAYRLMSEGCDYPLHLGVTEAGGRQMGTIKSAIGIGSLLCDGIGDTIRTSLTDIPEQEVTLGFAILKCCGLYKEGVEIISCPTCGRCQIDLIAIAQEAEKRLSGIRAPLKVAIMGCAVNGPGEAKEADIGIAGGRGEALLFKKGEIVRKVEGEHIVDELLGEIQKMI